VSDTGPGSRLIPIGRFAQLAGFTVRALRHYESQGLLEPAHVDRESGYRYYRPEQLPDALRVRLLRALEMPLAEVVEVMREPDGLQALEKIRAHRARVAERLADVEKLLLRIDEWLDGAPQELDVPAQALDDAPAAGDGHRVNESLARAFLGLFGPGDEAT
jgi:DNA-binding transcriptional MerR regulator